MSAPSLDDLMDEARARRAPTWHRRALAEQARKEEQGRALGPQRVNIARRRAGSKVTPNTIAAGGVLGGIVAVIWIGVSLFRRSPDAPPPTGDRPPPTPTGDKPPSPAMPPASFSYAVQERDSPHRIAARYLGKSYNTRRPVWWAELQAANPAKPLAAPDRWKSLLPGDIIQIPAAWRAAP